MVFSLNTIAQCPCAATNFGTIDVAGWTVGQSANISTCIYGGERSTINNTVNGAVYRVSSCGAPFDTQVTIYTNPGCVYVAYNDDNGPACAGTAASVDFTSPGGSLFAVLNRYNCTTENTCMTMSIQLISLPASGPGTSAISSICGSPRVTVSGAGAIQWQGSPDNVTFTDIGGATAATYNIPAASPNSYFRNRNGATYSNVVQVVPLSPPSNITVTMGTIMGGTYNISGNFTVNAGQTINMIDACAVQITAVNVTMSGTINGDGRGNAGGTGGAGGLYALNASDITCNGGYGGAGGGAGVGTGGGTAGTVGGSGGCRGQICGGLFCIGNQDGYNGGGAGGSGGAGGTYGGTGGLGAFSASGAGFSSPAVSGGNWVQGNTAPAVYGTASGTDIALGSGGGGGGGGGGAMANGTQGGAGGRGGGMVEITATNNLTVSGTIRCNGTLGNAGGNGGGRSFDNTWNCSGITGYNGCPICPQESYDAPAGAGGGAGGGSGGGIKLVGNGIVTITGNLQSIGGTGGGAGLPNPSHGTCFDHARGGAGGGGGRIKIFSNPCLNHNISPTVAYNGGTGGTGHISNGVSGNIGTYTINNHPSYAPLNGGSIATNQSFCEGNIPNPFTNSSSPSGGLGTFSYAWYSCTGGACPTPVAGNPVPGAGWTNRGTNALTFAETNTLFQTTTYVRGTESGNCYAWSNIVTVTINPQPIVTCPANFAVCDQQPSFPLMGGSPAGGTYTGPGVTAGTFTPSSAGVGTHTITYTYTDANLCTNFCTYQITVHPLPFVSCPSFIGTCINSPAFTLNVATPAGGTYTGTGVTGGVFNPSAAGVGSHTITYIYTDANLCNNITTFQIHVHNIPTVTCPTNISVCQNDPPFALSGATPAGGTYSGTGVSGGTFTPSVAGPGTHTITYSYTDGNSCTNTCNFTVTVNAMPIVSCPSNSSVCISNAPFALSGALPAGGTYSGTGVSGGIFDPSSAGLGTHTITYTYTDGNSCTQSCSYTITVYNLPSVTCPPNMTSCINGSNITLSGAAPLGGTFSGPGVSAGVFNPSMAGTGTHNINYLYSDVNGCSNSCNFSITVFDIPVLSCPTDQLVCLNTPAFTLSGATPAGGTYFGNGVAAGQFFPSTAGTGTHAITYSYTDGNLCTATCNYNITVNPNPIVTFAQHTFQLCQNAPLQLNAQVSSGTTPYSHTWTGNGALHLSSNSVTNPVFLTGTTGTYGLNYTVTDNLGCSSSDSITIIVHAQYDATIVSTQTEYCDNSSIIILEAQTSGGTWSGNGIIHPVNGVFNPSLAGIGSHTITYGIPGLCGDTSSVVLTVHASPSISLISDNESCIGASDGSATAIVTGGTPPFTVYWCNGNTGNVISGLAPGACAVWAVDNNGCTATDTLQILPATEECYTPHAYIANIFSPNGDGENDILYVRGEGIESFEFIVYNRWGETVFSTQNQNQGWDGTYKGKPLEPGVYVYFLKATMQNNEFIERSGNFTLVR